MLIRKSGHIDSGLFLLTCGEYCSYLLCSSININEIKKNNKIVSQPFVLFDPGSSAHSIKIVERLTKLGFSIKDLQFVFFTHTHPERCSGLHYLRSIQPDLKVIGTSAQKIIFNDPTFIESCYTCDQLWSNKFNSNCSYQSKADFATALIIDEQVAETELIELTEDCSIRVIPFPGHTKDSVAFYLLPHQFIIADEGIGYLRGRNLASPSPDYDIEQLLHSLEKIGTLQINGLCFPWSGVLVGAATRSHLSSIIQNITDIRKEVDAAISKSVSREEIRMALYDSFWRQSTKDPVLRYCMEASCSALYTTLGV